MKPILLIALAVAYAVSTTVGCTHVLTADAPAQVTRQRDSSAKKTLRAFRSQQELASFFHEISEKQKRERRRRQDAMPPSSASAGNMNSITSTTTTTAAKSVADKDESVTNVQHAGVDEGGIVKAHGDYLVVLRRGRLFTIRVGDGDLRPISIIDAFAPDINPRETWYDEMLISGDRIAVIGYSYKRGGTEIGLFQIGHDGALRYQATYQLRSNDYYSSRNYASRLVDGKLVFYTPLYLSPADEDPLRAFPSLRKWHKGATDAEFRLIVAPTRVYRTERPLNATNGLALHTVTVCDLMKDNFTCEATAVVGSPGRVFYVSPKSVYAWTSDWSFDGEGTRTQSMLYRMPLDGSAPSALGVKGSPVDQFSFLESADDYLNVLVRSEATGDGMWRAETSAGDVALMRVPLTSFADGSDAAPASSYRDLPKPQGYTFQNHFVGDYLLYGTGSGWGTPEKSDKSHLYAVRWAASGDAYELPLIHGVDRIEAMGTDAVVVGTDGRNLHFTSVRLGDHPTVAHRYTREDAAQGELRSQGFFYKAEDQDSGVLGLPIRGAVRPGYEHLFDESASILFLQNDSLELKELGGLAARKGKSIDDGCRASCVDWYGNSRPLFLRGRIFAMLGYEVVEGNITEGRIRETRRISFAPQRQSR